MEGAVYRCHALSNLLYQVRIPCLVREEHLSHFGIDRHHNVVDG